MFLNPNQQFQFNSQHIPWITGLTDDEGAFKASAFFSEMKTVREFEEDFEKIGPLMFGLHDGQSEAPKVNAQKVRLFRVLEETEDGFQITQTVEFE